MDRHPEARLQVPQVQRLLDQVHQPVPLLEPVQYPVLHLEVQAVLPQVLQAWQVELGLARCLLEVRLPHLLDQVLLLAFHHVV